MSKTSNNKLSFEEKELFILRNKIDKIEQIKGRQLIKTPEIQKIITIIETFLKQNKLICYGGTAINNILPKDDQFYNANTQLPDYDFFSKTPIKHAKQLADIYFKAGYQNVEAKTGVHHGTYKVFVNFIAIADITFLDTSIYNRLFKDSIRVDGIYYAAPNYLRMSMYLELSRPDGDITRWEKVYKRLSLLNKHYPLTSNIKCTQSTFKIPSSTIKSNNKSINKFIIDNKQCFNLTLKALKSQNVMFFGRYAIYLYSQYMDTKYKKLIEQEPDFDVFSEEAEKTANIIKERIETKFDKVKIIKHDAIGEIIPVHYEVCIGNQKIVNIYETFACHGYNNFNLRQKTIRVASIDTILSMYLAFLYADKPYYDKHYLLCASSLLFDIQRHHNLSQKGILERFSISCYGNQETIDAIRIKKDEMWQMLKNKRNAKEYDEWFLNYKPVKQNKSYVKTEQNKNNTSKSNSTGKSKSKSTGKSKSNSTGKSKSKSTGKSNKKTVKKLKTK